MRVNPGKYQWVVYLVAVAFLWYSFQRASSNPQRNQISYSEFLSEVRAGHASDVRIEERRFIAKLKTDQSKGETAKEISTERLPAMY